MTISNFAAFSKISNKEYFMRIACWQTILLKYHTLFCRKLGKMLQNLSSAAVVIGTLRVNPFFSIYNSLLAYLMIYFGSLHCKHYETRSECSYGSILIRVHSVCFDDKFSFRCNIYAAEVKCRRQFQDKNIGRIRVNIPIMRKYGFLIHSII